MKTAYKTMIMYTYAGWWVNLEDNRKYDEVWLGPFKTRKIAREIHKRLKTAIDPANKFVLEYDIDAITKLSAW